MAVSCDGVAITLDCVVDGNSVMKNASYRTHFEWVKSGVIGFQTNHRTDGLRCRTVTPILCEMVTP